MSQHGWWESITTRLPELAVVALALVWVLWVTDRLIFGRRGD